MLSKGSKQVGSHEELATRTVDSSNRGGGGARKGQSDGS